MDEFKSCLFFCSSKKFNSSRIAHFNVEQWKRTYFYTFDFSWNLIWNPNSTSTWINVRAFFFLHKWMLICFMFVYSSRVSIILIFIPQNGSRWRWRFYLEQLDSKKTHLEIKKNFSQFFLNLNYIWLLKKNTYFRKKSNSYSY